MPAEKAEKKGLFFVQYEIGKTMPGAPQFAVYLTVNQETETVIGAGKITQVVSPPMVEIPTTLQGDFTYMTVMPKNVHILVTATGFPPVIMPIHGGVGPVLQANVHLRMVLESDWKSGTATYSYFYKDTWHKVEGVPVKLASLKETAAA